MPDILLDGIPVIDLLEITPSTQEVALRIQRDQSSVSRAFRRISAQLDLGFGKDEGIYRATANLELLSHLHLALCPHTCRPCNLPTSCLALEYLPQVN